MKKFKKFIFIFLLILNILILPAYGQSGGTVPTPTPTPTSSGVWENPSEDPCYLLHPPDQSANGGGVFGDAVNMLISILPSTPTNLRLPTILSNLGGQGSLAGNFAYELYTAAWQYYAVIALIKFYKLIPGKLT